MSSTDRLVQQTLERQVPLRLDRRPDWEGVLARSRRTRRAPRRVPALIAFAAALAVVASALAATGHDPFGTLSSWLGGAPGRPASPEQQAGFSARNGASYAAFPTGTQLRRLTQASVAGRTFVLLGFKSGESLCLRLVRADEPSSRGINQCVTTRELETSQTPALVASEAVLEVGKHTTLADAIIGFADDTVKSVRYRAGRGAWKTAPVENNVFVGLIHRKVVLAHSSLPQPVSTIDQVRALTTSDRTIAIPFVSGYVTYPTGLPTVPSYVTARAPRPDELPGPAATTARFPGGTISWLVHREPRGSAWKPARFRGFLGNSVVYSRAVQPDPGSPLRIGLSLRRASSMFSPKQVPAGALALCETRLVPLGAPGGGFGCFPPTPSGLLFRPGEPTHLDGFEGGQQITTVAGVAADAVARLELFLASGRTVPVFLTDNAFTAGAPTTQFPAKLVAFDSRGGVIGIQMIGGPAHPVPCPALDVWPASKLPATRPYQRLDLATLTVDGHQLLGMTPAQVSAALGKPDRAAGFKHLGFGQPAYFYGGTLPSGTLLRVQFHREKTGVRAVALDFQGRGLLDTKLGHILNTPPDQLAEALVSTYSYRTASAYGSRPAALGLPSGVGCSAVVSSRSGTTQVDTGVDTYENARPYLNITTAPATASRP